MGAIKATLDQDAAYDIQRRVVSNLKGVRYVHARGKVFRNADGIVMRLVGTAQDITERKHLEDELKRQARTDFLTGLSSRGHFLEQSELELSRAIRYDNAPSIFMIDIDFFKQVNDILPSLYLTFQRVLIGNHTRSITLQQYSSLCLFLCSYA
jgi:predicted signal transduction protein with EAL and GGDEF domain